MKLFVHELAPPHGPISKSVEIHLDEKKPLGRGATATVYPIVTKPFGDQVAKIYRDSKYFDGDKIRTMLATRPPFAYAQAPSDAQALAWPSHVIYGQKNHPVGYLMPRLSGASSFPLNFFFEPLLAKSTLPTNDRSLTARLTIGRNLASVLAALHGQGHYVIDFKPQNIKVFSGTLLVSVLDCDSFSVKSSAGKRFPATNYTSEYIAPEALRSKKAPQDLGEEQDRYALAVVLFQLLNNGIHPFQGILQVKQFLPATDDRVRGGYYAYGHAANPDVRPSPGSIHECFSDEFRQLFDRAFQNSSPQRPSAQEWTDAFTATLTGKKLRPCNKHPSDATHIRFDGKPCGLCRFDAIVSSAKASKKMTSSVPKLCSSCGRSSPGLLLVCPSCGSHAFGGGKATVPPHVPPSPPLVPPPIFQSPPVSPPTTPGRPPGTAWRRFFLWLTIVAILGGAIYLWGRLLERNSDIGPSTSGTVYQQTTSSTSQGSSSSTIQTARRPVLPSRIGPSFDCTSSTAASQPLARTICQNSELARAELRYVIATWALVHVVGPQQRQALTVEADRFVVQVTDGCGIPRSGYFSATSSQISCIASWFGNQRSVLVGRLPSDALAEAQLEPEEIMEIQGWLQQKGWLPADASIDGVIGPMTRQAILGWQGAAAVRQTGFASSDMLSRLRW